MLRIRSFTIEAGNKIYIMYLLHLVPDLRCEHAVGEDSVSAM